MTNRTMRVHLVIMWTGQALTHKTACGIDCSQEQHSRSEFGTLVGNLIEGTTDAARVTCKRCLNLLGRSGNGKTT